ncbi:ricin-type beta-trefoil lectin domain protein [Kitasatospora sp. MAA4]|uniref:ricin-type beta-trefoil lectin domain protein n=1 Tax=Kitasatospora sp. MAA4 TaxID=3035093 RepID=UPI0024759499|nr:ricin-type beta-trefoil lectin domain protein [Kitasatospora sp. MAA4]
MAAVALIAAAAVSVQLVALTAPTTTEPGGTAIAVSDAPSPDASYTLPATATPPAASTPPDASTASATAPAATPSAVTATQSTHNPPVSSRPSPMPIDAQPVPAVLVDPASGRCLNVDTADSSVGLRSCDGRPTQQWVATAHAELRTQDTGLCLAPSSDAVQPGTRVMVRSCTGSASQQWTAQSGGSLFNPSSGLCLDVLSGYTNSTAPLQLWTCA